jgi:hypothetical protein
MMGLMYSRSLTRSDIVRPERGTTCASSRRGNVSVGEVAMGRAPREAGLKRPPWRMVWSCDLKCVSWGTREAMSDEKSSGSSGFGDDDDPGEDGCEECEGWDD